MTLPWPKKSLSFSERCHCIQRLIWSTAHTGQISVWPFKFIEHIIRYAFKRRSYCTHVFSLPAQYKLQLKIVFVKTAIFYDPWTNHWMYVQIWWPTIPARVMGNQLQFSGFFSQNNPRDIWDIWQNMFMFRKSWIFFYHQWHQFRRNLKIITLKQPYYIL